MCENISAITSETAYPWIGFNHRQSIQLNLWLFTFRKRKEKLLFLCLSDWGSVFFIIMSFNLFTPLSSSYTQNAKNVVMCYRYSKPSTQKERKSTALLKKPLVYWYINKSTFVQLMCDCELLRSLHKVKINYQGNSCSLEMFGES